MPVLKFDHESMRWETIGDLARYLLTHEDELEAAVVSLSFKDRGFSAYAVPIMQTSRAIGLLACGQHYLWEHASGNNLFDGGWHEPPA